MSKSTKSKPRKSTKPTTKPAYEPHGPNVLYDIRSWVRTRCQVSTLHEELAAGRHGGHKGFKRLSDARRRRIEDAAWRAPNDAEVEMQLGEILSRPVSYLHVLREIVESYEMIARDQRSHAAQDLDATYFDPAVGEATRAAAGG